MTTQAEIATKYIEQLLKVKVQAKQKDEEIIRLASHVDSWLGHPFTKHLKLKLEGVDRDLTKKILSGKCEEMEYKILTRTKEYLMECFNETNRILKQRDAILAKRKSTQ